MKLVCISDTHNQLDKVSLPDGDVLVHAGDFTYRGSLKEIVAFRDVLGMKASKYQKVFIVAGNHDFAFEDKGKEVKEILSEIDNLVWLDNEYIGFGGLSFYGSSEQPWFHDWAYNRSEEYLKSHWGGLLDVDVLITHTPAYGILDRTIYGKNVGCKWLLDAIGRVKPRLHVFGHIHESYGREEVGDTLCVNAALCNIKYEPTNAPIVVDL